MKIGCIQMDMKLGAVEENIHHAKQLIEECAKADPDVILLPELWNTGFFPKENLFEMADPECRRIIKEIGTLAASHRIHIVAGSVANRRSKKIYNTACVFDRSGNCIAQYDKTHLFSPMEEDRIFENGDHLCRFTLGQVRCGIVICYDIRFPELIRSLSIEGIDILFIAAQWPDVRIPHLHALATARAIENQMFVACCNSCGTAEDIQFGGRSLILDPWGNTLCTAGNCEEIVFAECDLTVLQQIRTSIDVFADRRPELYRI